MTSQNESNTRNAGPGLVNLTHGLIGLVVSMAILIPLILIITRGGNSASPHQAVGAFRAAAVVTCQTDFQEAQTAIEAYQVLKGKDPVTVTDLKPWLNAPLTTSGFAITLDPNQQGQLDVTAPGHGPTPGNGNCAYAT